MHWDGAPPRGMGRGREEDIHSKRTRNVFPFTLQPQPDIKAMPSGRELMENSVVKCEEALAFIQNRK